MATFTLREIVVNVEKNSEKWILGEIRSYREVKGKIRDTIIAHWFFNKSNR